MILDVNDDLWFAYVAASARVEAALVDYRNTKPAGSRPMMSTEYLDACKHKQRVGAELLGGAVAAAIDLFPATTMEREAAE